MADLTYFMLAPMEHNGVSMEGYPGRYVTMLATGDDEADYQTMREHAHAEGIEGTVFIGKWCSGSSGDERHEDGKDKFRAHDMVHCRYDLLKPDE